jgi:hypothetical protein
VQGVSDPWEQPPPLTYTVVATVNPTSTPDCAPGSQKTYSVRAPPALPCPPGQPASHPACLPALPPALPVAHFPPQPAAPSC